MYASRVKKKLLLKNRFYWWSLLDKYNFYAWCPPLKFAFIEKTWSPRVGEIFYWNSPKLINNKHPK